MASVSQQAREDFTQEEMESWVTTDPLDPFDITRHHPSVIGQGTTRSIQLREGLELSILDVPLGDQVSIAQPEEMRDGIELHFHIHGHHEDGLTQVGDREFCIVGRGIHPKHCLHSVGGRTLEVWLWLKGESLQTILTHRAEALPPEVAPWLRPADERCYARVGKVTPPIERVLWEVVRCPWQGVAKRLFLEGKALELLSLMVGWEQARQGQPARHLLPTGTRERVHYARELLLQNLHEPLTLAELARRAQINESALKQGFKQEFGMTVFDYLLDYRLEQARDMLEQGTMQVAQVMTAVGLKNRSYFAAAFRQKFGQNPKQYQQQFWQ